MYNPFLTTKPNYAPTFMIIPQQPRQKAISILPIEEPKPTVTDEVAKSAMKLETARKISVTGDATGAGLFDGSADSEIKISVKNSERAIKDGNGKEISKTYAPKTELANFAKKSEVTEKINYLESVLFATKSAVNAFQNDLNSAKEKIFAFETNLAAATKKINALETTLNATKETVTVIQNDLNDVVNNGSTSIGGENITFAGDDDINNLFGD